MKLKTALLTISVATFLSISSVYSQDMYPVETDMVTVTGQITVDIYSTVNLNPVTVEIYQPSTVTIRILSPLGVGIPGRSVEIVSPVLNITQPTSVTDSIGSAVGSVYATTPGTYLVCAKDTTLEYDISIQNCKTLYVVPVAVPTFLPESYYTKGTTNTLLWNTLGSGYQYYIEVSEDPNFGSITANSGWVPNTSYQFVDLEDSKMYFYRVKAKNVYGGQSSWSSTVFSVQDAQPPVIDTISIGGVGDNDTVDWDSNDTVKMIFRVTDNLQLESATFLCVNSKGQTYTCTSDYYMEGDNLIVNIKLGDLERVSGAYLRESYEFCVEARDTAGNITRVCNIELTVPKGKVEPAKPPIIDQIEKVVEDIGDRFDNTVGQLEPVDLERVTATTSIITVTTGLLITIGSLLNLPYFLLQFILNLLSWLGFRAGARPLGYVYDALTKEPISQAIVRVYDESGKIVWSDVTDSNGYFSAKLDAGKYRIEVRVPDYTYPSNIVFGKEDYPLINVYHGEYFQIGNEKELNFAIPLDPKEASKFKIWREIVWGRIKVFVNILHVLLFIVGLALAIYLYSKNPYWLTLLILILYIPSFFLMIRNVFAKRERYGVVTDLDGNRVEGIVIGLREMEFEKVVNKRVTDSLGRYRMLVGGGRYRLEVMDTGYKVERIEGDSEILIEKREEWVVNDITVSRYKEGGMY